MLLWLVMKKDSELPWGFRLARWIGLVYVTAYATMYMAHRFKEWFL